jgi:hypothetical protein
VPFEPLQLALQIHDLASLFVHVEQELLDHALEGGNVVWKSQIRGIRHSHQPEEDKNNKTSVTTRDTLPSVSTNAREILKNRSIF